MDWLILLSLIIIRTIFFIYPRRRQHASVKQWKAALAINKHFAIFHQLYQSVDGFSLSKKERIGRDAFEYTYGEIEFESFIALLSLCNPDASSVFYDLGSGTGKPVLACAMVFNVKKCCGIELFSSLHQCAITQQQRLQEIPDYIENAGRIEFKQGDFLHTPFADASLIFINATGYFGDTWVKISKCIEQITPGSLVLSTSKALSSNAFICLQKTQIEMSWGIVAAFIQKRL